MKYYRLSVLWITFYGSILFVAFFFFLVLSIYFGNNPLNKSVTIYPRSVSVFPQGWAFFTGSSKNSRYLVYSENMEVLELRSFSFENYYGASRHNRILNIEINNVFEKIFLDSIQGLECSDLNIFFEDNSQKKYCSQWNFVKIIIEQKQSPNLQGDYFFVEQLTLPWSLLSKKPDYPIHYNVYPIHIIHK